MTKMQMGVRFVAHYSYDGGDTIEFWRTNGSEVVYQDWLRFDSDAEAKAYFDNEC